MSFNRELGQLTVGELTSIKFTLEGALENGLSASRLGLRLALHLSDAVERELKKRGRSAELGTPGNAHTKSRKKRKG